MALLSLWIALIAGNPVLCEEHQVSDRSELYVVAVVTNFSVVPGFKPRDLTITEGSTILSVREILPATDRDLLTQTDPPFL